MAYPDPTMTSTTLAGVIPTVWTSKLNDFYRSKLVCANFFTNLSSEIAGGGKTFEIPNINQMTANVKANQAAVTLNANTDGKISLVVDTWYECSFQIEKREAREVMQSYGIQERYIKNAGYSVAAVLEDAIIALFDNFSQTVGASTAGVADSDIRAAIKYLSSANCDLSECAFFFSPKAVWTDVMALDKFTLVQNTGGADPVLKGAVGKLYGIPVFESSRIGTTLGSAQNCLAHKDAIIHAETAVSLDTNYIPEYLAFLSTADIQFGVIENRDTSGVWIKTAAA
jgi:hypothetical protein